MSEEEKKAIETIQNYNNKKAVDLSLYFVDVSNASKIILNLIEKQQKEIKELEDSYFNQKMYINGLTIATGIALNGKTVEVSKKTLYELENTMKIEQVYIPENDSYRFRAR